MDLVLVTGAGASRRLGEPEDLLPLMQDWADALCTALDAVEPNLASACRLAPGMNGQQFEEALGLLLRWEQVRSLEERFAGLGGVNAGQQERPAIEYRQRTANRLGRIMGAVNETLYQQFGQERVSDERAAEAYGSLLRFLDVSDLVVATTNYDRAGEAALQVLGREVNTGFVRTGPRTPTLNVRGLMESNGDAVPYLHLHGAVGWYERDGTVYDFYGDQPFNPTLGTPVVLYPDPDKDPTNDATVSDLWREFRIALGRADHVLVLGHSLHDPALVDAIRAAEPYKLAVTVFRDEEVAWVAERLPAAIPMQMDFGPDLEVDTAAVAAFRG
jgi:hypothetical protein